MSDDLDFIPITKPLFDDHEAMAVSRTILSGWVTQGPEVAAFEREFSESVGASYACAVSSCTSALHLALVVVGVEEGDEVITVSHSYIATANSIRYCGATPVFVDIDPTTFNLDPTLLESAITNRTRAILCVHQMGMPSDLRLLLQFAKRHSLPVIEDAACAIGSETLWQGRWEKIGRPHGDVACFSFHPRKVITTGDGGMLTTANPEFDRRFRQLRQHSMSVSDAIRHASKRVSFEEYSELGYNYRMTDIQAAVGREQLKRLPDIIARRRELALRYHKLIAGVPGVKPPFEPAFAKSNWQSYSIRLPHWSDQRATMQFMLDRGVATRRGIMCAHREPAYATGQYRAATSLTESEAAQDRSIILPLFHQMSSLQQDRVVETLAESVRSAQMSGRAQPQGAH